MSLDPTPTDFSGEISLSEFDLDELSNLGITRLVLNGADQTDDTLLINFEADVIPFGLTYPRVT